jgi:hypothetical protein
MQVTDDLSYYYASLLNVVFHHSQKEKHREENQTYTFKIITYWAGGVAQMIDCLPNKHKALSSSPSKTTQNTKKP